MGPHDLPQHLATVTQCCAPNNAVSNNAVSNSVVSEVAVSEVQRIGDKRVDD